MSAHRRFVMCWLSAASVCIMTGACERMSESPLGPDSATGTRIQSESLPQLARIGPPDIVVNATADIADFAAGQTVADLPGPDGKVTLREAIIAANNTPGQHVIGFRIPKQDAGFDGKTFTVNVMSRLPALSGEGTTINGATQSNFTGETNPNGPEIVLDGGSLEPGIEVDALNISSANNRVHCLVIDHFFCGIGLGGSQAINTVITGCYIGVDPSGREKRPGTFFGVGGQFGVSGVRVGGTNISERNVIAGYNNAIFFSWEVSNIAIENNYIGTDAAGTNVLGYNWGVTIGDRCSNAIVRNNLISGGQAGIFISADAHHIVIEGNRIGTDARGKVALGNEIGIWGWKTPAWLTIKDNLVAASSWTGIRLDGGTDVVVVGNLIGTDVNGRILPAPLVIGQGIALNQGGGYDDGSTTEFNRVRIGGVAACDRNIIRGGSSGITVGAQLTAVQVINNVISDNSSNGVGIVGSGPSSFLLLDNEIVRNGDGISIIGECTGYTVSRNMICSNNGLGIDLVGGGSGVTLNDPGDFDAGPNNLMNFPVLTSAVLDHGRLVVQGEIDTQDPSSATIEVFANASADPSGYGEGALYIGSVKPDAQGTFIAVFSPLSRGTKLSATATDANGNTSEFCQNIQVIKP